MGACSNLATKAELQNLESKVAKEEDLKKYIPQTEKAMIYGNARQISMQLIQAGTAWQASRIANALETANKAKRTADSANNTARSFKGTAMAAANAAKKASYDALYASNRAASAASLASRGMSAASKALGLIGGVMGIVSTLVTGVAFAALSLQVANLKQRVERSEKQAREANLVSETAKIMARNAQDTANTSLRQSSEGKEIAQNALNLAKSASRTASEADLLANKANVNASIAQSTSQSALEKVRDMQGQVSEAKNKANEAIKQADKAFQKTKYYQKTIDNLKQENVNLRNDISKLRRDLDKKVDKKDFDRKIRDIQMMGESQAQRIISRINSLNFPSASTIAFTVAGADIFKQILSRASQAANKGSCLAPGIVAPINAATVAQNVITHNLLKDPKTGLKAIQTFAQTAWKSTRADKIMGAITNMVVLHNAIMLSSNLGTTISETLNLSLQALGLRDEEDKPININNMVRGGVRRILRRIMGQEAYKLLSQRVAAGVRVYQASANVLSNVRSIFDASQSIAETTGENVAFIGNALKKSGAVRDDLYGWMDENVKINNTSRVIRRLEGLNETASIFEDVASEVKDISEEITDMKNNQQEFKETLDKAKQEYTKKEDDLKKGIDSVIEPKEEDENRAIPKE